MTMTTAQSITSGQMRQVRLIVETAVVHALEKDELCRDNAQLIIEHGDKLKARIREIILDLAHSDVFKSEEAPSSSCYAPEFKVKSVGEQVDILRAAFPGIFSYDAEVTEWRLPRCAEGWFAIPLWEKIAPTYGEAVAKVVEALRNACGGLFCNFEWTKFHSDYLQETKRKVTHRQMLLDMQRERDIFIFPAQFGLRHRGRSMRRANEILISYEFGLGAYEVGMMLLTHPERIRNDNELFIDCIGDEFRVGLGEGFGLAPTYRFRDRLLELSSAWIGRTGSSFGAATGFCIQL